MPVQHCLIMSAFANWEQKSEGSDQVDKEESMPGT